MKLEGKARMLRIHFGEDDKWHNKPLYQAIVEKCRELDIAGATVFRGIEGYGASTLIHRPHLLSFSSDAPIMVSVIDTEEKIRQLIPTLDQMVDEGLIAISDVEVIKYVHQDGARSITDRHGQHPATAPGQRPGRPVGPRPLRHPPSWLAPHLGHHRRPRTGCRGHLR